MLSSKYVGFAVDVLLDKTLKAMAASEDAINALMEKEFPQYSISRICLQQEPVFGKLADLCNRKELPKTVISREYSSEWKPSDEPYYPVNDEKNNGLYEQYRQMADREEKVCFGGRLGEYKYYDMDAVILSALTRAREML